MTNIRKHPQTILAKDAILAAVKPEERGRVRVSEASLRQTEGLIVLENHDCLDVTQLIVALPSRSRVFSRAPHKGGAQVVLSRLDVYYPLDDRMWRMRTPILVFIWVVMPVAGAFHFLFT
jgi:hypothetical protein